MTDKLQNTRALSEHILSALQAREPRINWQLYPDVQTLRGTKLPLAHLELQSFDLAPKITTDINTVECTFALRLLFNDTPLGQMNIRDAALAISTFIDGNYFKSEQLEAAQVIANQQDFFAPEIDGYISWEILFLIRFYYGDSVYEENGVSPEVEIDVNNNIVFNSAPEKPSTTIPR
ncbi:hypothetical protein [Caedibacter taeniospiralis]|uniref:hypothetical protein n=1 Tax=Caedibacter taeniospiralis TaxID=28907 RepID=UPI000C27270D|nr:hypothetical protein [Caedibacter taeniospiralis]